MSNAVAQVFELIPTRPPPVATRGILGWLKRNLFSDWKNSLGTLIVLALLVKYVPPLLDWAVFNAVARPDNKACRAIGHDLDDPLGKAWKFVPALACVEDDLELTGTGDPAHGIPKPAPQLVMPMIPNVEPFITLGATGYPGYAPNQLAKMCVAQEGWTAIGTNGSGQKLRQYWHKVIDNADGGAQLSN